MADAFLPAVIFSCLVMILGLLGNSVVCYICQCRLHKTVVNSFVMALAVLDVLGCSLCVPLEVAELRNRDRAWEPGLCILQRFFRSVLIVSSVFILVAIAVERYRRICHPLTRHITLRQCRVAIVAAVVIAVVLSWPSLFIFGEKSVLLSEARRVNGSATVATTTTYKKSDLAAPGTERVNGSLVAMMHKKSDLAAGTERVNGSILGTMYKKSDLAAGTERVNGSILGTMYKKSDLAAGTERVNGSTVATMYEKPVLVPGTQRVNGSLIVKMYECGVKDSMRESVYPVMYFTLLFVLFFLSSVLLCVLYVRIACRIWRPRKLRTDMSRAKSASLPDCRRLNVASDTVRMHGTVSNAVRMNGAVSNAVRKNGTTRNAVTMNGTVSNAVRKNGTVSNAGRNNGTTRNTAGISGTATMPAKLMEELTRSLQLRRKKRDALSIIMVPTPSFRRKRKAAYSRKRTTAIMFLMTLTSVVSYLPYILVSMVYVTSLGVTMMEAETSVAAKAVMEVCLKSFLISSAANPFIYGLCNRRFKKECGKVWREVKGYSSRRAAAAREAAARETDNTSDTPPNS